MAQATRIFSVPRPFRLVRYVSSRLRPLDVEPETIHAVLSQYGLEAVQPPRNLATGRRNRNVAVETAAGKKLLKGYRRQWKAETVIYAHSILNRLSELNFPAPRLVQALDGETFVIHGGHLYALLDFVGGTNYSTSYLLRIHRRQLMALAGQTLARFHRELQGFMPQGRHHMGFASYDGKRWRDIAWHADKISELKTKSLHLTRPDDQSHADWLIQNSNYLLGELGRLDETLSVAALPRTVIHGDYGLHNILFQKEGTVTPVDFELTRLEWRLSDLVSCLSRYRFGSGAFDLESIRWFMGPYQAEYPLSPDEWRSLPGVWRFYKLQSAVQYWNSYFETSGPVRKLISARDAVRQADWALEHPDRLLALNTRGASTVVASAGVPGRAVGVDSR